MKTVVRARPGDALGVMRRALRGGAPLEAEYPLVFGADAAGSFVVAEEAGAAAAGCAVLVRELVLPGGRLRVGLIGSVCTDADRRGRGLASAVLLRAEAELAAAGCALALLWADDAEFYERRGYAEVGAERDYLLEPELASHLPACAGVRDASGGDLTRLHELYAGHTTRVERSAAESVALYTVPGMRVVVRERDGEVDAYACLGRGGDLHGVVHEWAGDAEGVLACVRALLEPRDEPLFLMAPVTASELSARLDALGAPSALGVLGMGKPLDGARLVDELCAAADVPLVWTACGGERWRLEGPAGASELDIDQLVACVLAPRAERHRLDELEAALGVRFGALPRTPFVWGLDSI
ncbi:MAG: GNAT family N-acetyltransferase [Planctomycetes bacterium]|nr:GNAT family N-acetyltransferase [Planctomycetota bacterium]